MNSPNPPGVTAITDNPEGVSCANTTSCFAVGNYSTYSTSGTLVEHWNGYTWSNMTTPKPAGSNSPSLVGVSCPSADSCFAVGAYAFPGIEKSLIEDWNGYSWSIMTSPNPAISPETSLMGVSCHGTTSCFAVGEEGSNEGGTPGKTFVEHWNGSAWSIMASPNPGGTPGDVLSAVSCPGTTSCFAVGQGNYAGSAARGLIERYA